MRNIQDLLESFVSNDYRVLAVIILVVAIIFMAGRWTA